MVNGKTTLNTERDSINLRMETSTKEISLMTSNKAKVFTLAKKALLKKYKENGKKTSFLDYVNT